MMGGLADYVAILAAALDEGGLAQTYLVAGERALRHRESITAKLPEAVVLNGTTPEHLQNGLAALEAETVILHYSGYGYTPRGAPIWLANGLERWKKAQADSRLIVMFHEIWASGLPWQSSFWLSLSQRHCVSRIARLADAVVTSTTFYRLRLQPFVRPGTEIHVQPIFSNVGELEYLPGFGERKPVGVVFGRGDTRRRTYERFRPYFDQLRMSGIERLVEVGSERKETMGLNWPFPVERLGPLEAGEVSAIMARARWGLFECPVRLAAKSTVFAGLAAHGVLPIHPDGTGSFDGLEFGVQTVCLERLARSHVENRADAIDGSAIHAWYRDHCVARQCEVTWLPVLARS